MIGICVITGKQDRTFVETRGDRMVWVREAKWCHVYSTEKVLPTIARRNKSCIDALSKIVADNTEEAEAYYDEKVIFESENFEKRQEFRSQVIEIQICEVLNGYCKETLFEPFQGEVGLTPQNTECCHPLSFKFTDTLNTYISARITAQKDGYVVSSRFKEWVDTKKNIRSLEESISSLQYKLKQSQDKYKGLLSEMQSKIPFIIKEELKDYLISNPEQFDSKIDLKWALFADVPGKFVPYDDLIFYEGGPSGCKITDMFPIDLALHTRDGFFLNTILLNGGHEFLEDGTDKPERIIRDSLFSSVSDLRAYGIAKQRWPEAYYQLRQKDSSFVAYELLQTIALLDLKSIKSLSVLFPDETSRAIDTLNEEGRIVEISAEDVDIPKEHQVVNVLGHSVYIKEIDVPVNYYREHKVGVFDQGKVGLRVAKNKYSNFVGFYRWLCDLPISIVHNQPEIPDEVLVSPRDAKDAKWIQMYENRFKEIVNIMNRLDQAFWGIPKRKDLFKLSVSPVSE